MYIREHNEIVDVNTDVIKRFHMESIAYFDIETTGFDKDKDYIVLISLGYFTKEGTLKIKQYYAEKLEDEKKLLEAFGEDIKNFTRWSSYNGMAFDEPFIIRKTERYKLSCKLPLEHIDLYRLIRPYHKQLGMDRCNLKTVEKFLGVDREDQIDGGISVELYNRYMETKEEEIRDIIMLHNFEDVLNLPKIFNLLYQIENNEALKREDLITEKQLKFLKSLVKKNKLVLYYKPENISKRAASKVIDAITSGNLNASELNNMIISSY
jgi:uncharacterized protein YprB with RNaseH-like and TPR domain